MTTRDDLADSEHDFEDLAALAAALYDSEGFEADLRAAVRDVLRDHVAESEHVDSPELDFPAEYVFEERLFKDGRGGLFLLRGQLVTNADADLAPGDVVRMQSASDPDKTVWYVVNRADPDAYRTSAIKVDPAEGERHYTDLTPGHVKFDDRYEVSHRFRDRDARAWSLAGELLDDLVAQREGDDD
jgi:hypothetical protein